MMKTEQMVCTAVGAGAFWWAATMVGWKVAWKDAMKDAGKAGTLADGIVVQKVAKMAGSLGEREVGAS